jgi:hypothetical protein
MNGCAILLFSKRKILPRIKEIFVCKVKTNTMGFASNKGTVALRFKID